MGSARKKSTKQFHSTGIAAVDRVIGGGLLAGRVILWGGFPKIGKTRTLLHIADHIAKTQGHVIYASGEESTEDLQGTAADLGLVNDKVTIMGNQHVVENVLDHANKIKAFLCFFDSAQKFMSKQSSGSTGSPAQLKAVGETIKDFCGATKTCAIVVNQMSGSGELKGGLELSHGFDTVVVLATPLPTDKEAPLEDGIRVLVCSENRIASDGLKAYFRMVDPGRLEEVPPRSMLDIEAPRGRKYRRDEDEEI